MFPVLPVNNMRYYTGASAAYTGSSPYAVPSQPPFENELHRCSRQQSQVSTRTPRSISTGRNSNSVSFRNSSTSSSRSNSSSSLVTHYNSRDKLDDLSRRGSGLSDSNSSTSSLSDGFRSLLHRSGMAMSKEEKAVKKAEKARRKQVERAEKAAYQRAQDMEATALYMAWRYGEGPNTVSYCMF